MPRKDRLLPLSRPSFLGCGCMLGAFLFILLSCCQPLFADQATEKQIIRKIQAGFVYNFIRFTTWPSTSLPEDAPLMVAIIGESSTAEILRRELDAKKYGTHAIVSKILEADDSLDGVHIVILLKKSALSPADLAKRIGKRPILSIGESENFLPSGGMIRLFMRDDSFHFALNVRAARESQITLSSQLSSTAEADTP